VSFSLVAVGLISGYTTSNYIRLLLAAIVFGGASARPLPVRDIISLINSQMRCSIEVLLRGDSKVTFHRKYRGLLGVFSP
jgi:hypothetical protein